MYTRDLMVIAISSGIAIWLLQRQLRWAWSEFIKIDPAQADWYRKIAPPALLCFPSLIWLIDMAINYLLPWIVTYWSIFQREIQFAPLLSLVIYAVLRKEFLGKWVNVGWGVVLIIVGNFLAMIADYIFGWRMIFVYWSDPLLLYHWSLSGIIWQIVLGAGILFFVKFFRFHLVRNEIDSRPPKLTTFFLLVMASCLFPFLLVVFSTFNFDEGQLLMGEPQDYFSQRFTIVAATLAFLFCKASIVSIILCPQLKGRKAWLGSGVFAKLFVSVFYGVQFIPERYFAEVAWIQIMELTFVDLVSTIAIVFVVTAIRHLFLKTGLSLVGLSGRIPAPATSSSLDEVEIVRVLDS